jgi:hypothetical protein
MTNSTSPKRAVLIALALSALSASVAFADDATTDSTSTTTAPTSGGWHHHHHHGAGVLSKDERAELKKDRDTVFANNAALKTQHDTLKQQFKALKGQDTAATSAQRTALKTQHQAYETQMRAAIVGVDSGASAIFAKLDAAKAKHQH